MLEKSERLSEGESTHEDLCLSKILATKDFDSKRVQCAVPSCDLQDEHHRTKMKYFACWFFLLFVLFFVSKGVVTPVMSH